MPGARRIFVTGGAGFIGSQLVGALRARGDVVTAPDLAEVDVLDVAALRGVLERATPDIVVHLAAISHVPACVADPGARDPGQPRRYRGSTRGDASGDAAGTSRVLQHGTGLCGARRE